MEIITIHTTQNIDIDYETGGLGERILALLIDYAIFIPLVILGTFLSFINSPTVIGAYFILIGIVFSFYNLLCETFFNGQSLGKRVMKIKVISLDGARPKFSQYLLRWLFRFVDIAITSGIAAVMTIALTEKGQRIGDLVAGTVMVRTVPRTKKENLAFAPVDDNYQPVYPQAVQLSDSDVALIHEVVSNYYKTGNPSVVNSMAARVRDHLQLGVIAERNDLIFLQVIIKDYGYVTSRADAL